MDLDNTPTTGLVLLKGKFQFPDRNSVDLDQPNDFLHCPALVEFQFPDRNSVDLDVSRLGRPAYDTDGFNSLIGILWI